MIYDNDFFFKLTSEKKGSGAGNQKISLAICNFDT